MAFQRAPLPDDEAPEVAPAPRGAHLRLVHSVDAPALDPSSGDAAASAAGVFTRAVEDTRNAAARGVVWGLAIALVGFWVPAIAAVAYLLSR